MAKDLYYAMVMFVAGAFAIATLFALLMGWVTQAPPTGPQTTLSDFYGQVALGVICAFIFGYGLNDGFE